MPELVETLVQQERALQQQFVDEAVIWARQVQERAEDVQERSRTVLPRVPEEATQQLETPREQMDLLYMGLGAVVVLGIAYLFLKRED